MASNNYSLATLPNQLEFEAQQKCVTRKCDICADGKTFDNLEYEFHMSQNHLKELQLALTCKICGLHFPNLERIQSHLDNHNGEPGFPCKLCPAKFLKEFGLTQHTKMVHRGLRCGVCQEISPTLADFKAHKRTVHGMHFNRIINEKKYKCGSCSKGFTKRSSLFKHEELKICKNKLHSPFSLERKKGGYSSANGSCLICHERFLPNDPRLFTEVLNPKEEMLERLASVLEVTSSIYQNVFIDAVPEPVCCTSCHEKVLEAFKYQEEMRILEKQLKRLSQIIAKDIIKSFHLDTRELTIMDPKEVRLIRKTYAQCLGTCTVRATSLESPYDLLSFSVQESSFTVENCNNEQENEDLETFMKTENYMEVDETKWLPLEQNVHEKGPEGTMSSIPKSLMEAEQNFYGEDPRTSLNFHRIDVRGADLYPKPVPRISNVKFIQRDAGGFTTYEAAVKGNSDAEYNPDVSSIENREGKQTATKKLLHDLQKQSDEDNFETNPGFDSETSDSEFEERETSEKSKVGEISEMTNSKKDYQILDVETSNSEMEEREIPSGRNKKTEISVPVITKPRDDIVAVKCDLCDLTFKNTVSLKNHTRRLHENSCKYCDEMFKTKLLLDQHCESVHDQRNPTATSLQVFSGSKGSKDSSEKEQNIIRTTRKNSSTVSYQEESESDNSVDKYQPKSDSSSESSDSEFEKTMAKNKKNVIKSQSLKSRQPKKRKTIRIRKPPSKGKKFKCDHCDSHFNSETNRRLHMEIHLGFVCKHCGETFQSRILRQLHYENTHDQRRNQINENRRRKCGFCDKTFETVPLAQEHMESIHAVELNASIICEICGVALRDEERYKDHMSYHNGGPDFSCKFCPAKFSNEPAVKAHTKILHTGNIKCGICKQICPTLKEFREHKQSVHGEDYNTIIHKTGPKCPTCNKQFSKAESLKMHLKVVHGDGDNGGKKEFKCTLCDDAVFNSIRRLQGHLKIHKTGALPASQIPKESLPIKFQCNICHLQFRLQDKYEFHMNMHANPDEFISYYVTAKVDEQKNLISFDCAVCKRKFTQESHLNSEKQMEIRCDYKNCGCNVNFNDLNVYMHHHKNICQIKYAKEHFKAALVRKCETCGKAFKNSSNLAKHVARMHPGPDSYMCQYCGRAFAQKYGLEFHMVKHLTGKNVQCHICGKEYKTKQSLAAHMVNCHNDKLIPCDICGRELRSKQYLTRHKRAMHSGSEPKIPCHICGKLFKTKDYVHSHIYTTHEKRRKSKGSK